MDLEMLKCSFFAFSYRNNLFTVSQLPTAVNSSSFFVSKALINESLNLTANVPS